MASYVLKPLALAFVFSVLFALAMTHFAHARDLDGRYAQNPLKSWFDGLQSQRGMCCSFADGATLEDVDWDTEGGHYRVRIEGKWIVVPDDAMLNVPNKFGRAVVWPYKDADGNTQIRCFIAGSGA